MVQVSNQGRKRFTQGFLDAAIALDQASDFSEERQKEEFVSFVNEFGTHYASITMLGARLVGSWTMFGDWRIMHEVLSVL